MKFFIEILFFTKKEPVDKSVDKCQNPVDNPVDKYLNSVDNFLTQCGARVIHRLSTGLSTDLSTGKTTLIY
jgi:hypothetical protein